MLSARQQLEALGVKLEDMEAEAMADGEESTPRFTDVQPGPELLRVLGLPRRKAPNATDASAIELAAFLTSRLAKTSNPYPGPLRPIVAAALKEAFDCKGLVGLIKAGGGKSALFYLLPVVLGAQRPLYLCPAMMEPDIRHEWGLMKPHWHGPQVPYPILSYEKLSNPSSGATLDASGKVLRHGLLERMAPTHIFMDEGHKAANPGAACTKRLKAYRIAHPECVFVYATGTPFKTSIKDAAHAFEWCLGGVSPLPRDFLERECWASYLDAKKGMGPRAGAGALLDFMTPEERREHELATPGTEDARRLVRQAISRRIFETPGVIGTQDPPLDTKLRVDAFYPEREDDRIEEIFAEFRETWTLPDGTVLADPMQYSRHCTTLGLGLWNRWLPSPPEEWREARKRWASWCMRAVRANRRGIDSEALMAAAVKKGLYNDEGALEGWLTARDAERKRTGLLEPPSVPVWESTEAIEAVAGWLSEHEGLVWVNSIGLGERLSADLKLPYYGADGLDGKGKHIKAHKGGSAIASIAANGTGRNLQKFWHKNLWLTTPGEQSLARTHRPGQKEDTVYNWIYLGCAEHLKSYYSAVQNKARFADELLGSPQRLVYATTEMPSMRTLSERGGERWQIKERG